MSRGQWGIDTIRSIVFTVNLPHVSASTTALTSPVSADFGAGTARRIKSSPFREAMPPPVATAVYIWWCLRRICYSSYGRSILLCVGIDCSKHKGRMFQGWGWIVPDIGVDCSWREYRLFSRTLDDGGAQVPNIDGDVCSWRVFVRNVPGELGDWGSRSIRSWAEAENCERATCVLSGLLLMSF